jgi:hypothetical protein
MGQSVFPVASTSSLSVSTAPLPGLPVGVTLRNTYTTSTTGITGLPSLVCVVLIGGGAAGGGTAGGNTSVNSAPWYGAGATSGNSGNLQYFPLSSNSTYYSPVVFAAAGAGGATYTQNGTAGSAVSSGGIPTLGSGGGSGGYGDPGSTTQGAAGGTPTTVFGITCTGTGGAAQNMPGSGATYRSGAGGGGGGYSGAGGAGGTYNVDGGDATGIGSGGGGRAGNGSQGNGAVGGGAGGVTIAVVPAFTACTVGAGGTGASAYTTRNGNGAAGAVLVYY